MLDLSTLFPTSAPKTLWHYTSSAAFLSILESKTMYLTHYGFMNDPSEGRLGSQLLARRLEASIDGSLRRGVPQIVRRTCADFTHPKRPPRPTFVASFSEEGDSLSQWARYGDDGRGLALGFRINTDCHEHFNAMPVMGPNLTRVRYVKRLKEDAVDDILTQAAKIMRDPTVEGDDLSLELSALFEFAAPAIKEQGYAEEKEWRLVLAGLDIADVPDSILGFRATARGIVPHIKMPLGEATLELAKVRFGPRHPRDTDHVIQRLLRYAQSKAKFDRSKLSYRA
jgi:hypothetical protein